MSVIKCIKSHGLLPDSLDLDMLSLRLNSASNFENNILHNLCVKKLVKTSSLACNHSKNSEPPAVMHQVCGGYTT